MHGEQEWMENYKKKLFEEDSVKYFLRLEISDIENNKNKEPDTPSFVSVIRKEIIDTQIPDKEEEWADFMEETKEIRKILAISHTIMDLLFFFSDYFEDDNPDEVKKEHERRVEMFENMLKLRHKINDSYKTKLKKFIEREYIESIDKEINNIEKELERGNIHQDLKKYFRGQAPLETDKPEKIDDEWKITNKEEILFVVKEEKGEKKELKVYRKKKPEEEPKVIIVAPIFPNVSLQSFSILSELKWLKKLIIDEETKSLKENVDIHILFLNKAFLNILNRADEEKKKYFYGYRTNRKNMVKSVLDLNKLRVESFVKRYLTEFIIKETKEEEIRKIGKWFDKHVKTIDEKAVFNNLWNKEEIKITEKKVVDNIIECDNDTRKDINNALNKTKGNYYFSDVGVPKMLEFPLDGAEKEKEATYEDILYYLKKEIPENTLIINVHTSRAFVLFDFYIDRICEGGKEFFGWDSYIPMTIPPIIPIFQYHSTFSKSYNFSLAEMYKERVYNCKEGDDKYTICYLAHFLEFLFDDVFKTFGLRVKGPKCKECESDTIIVKEDCNKLEESSKCGTKHWVFECTSHWEEHAPCGALTDYLWLPMEIFYTLEKFFLEIPYTFMLTKRKYSGEPGDESSDESQKEAEAVKTEFNTFKQISEEIIDELKEHFKRQKEYLEKEKGIKK